MPKHNMTAQGDKPTKSKKVEIVGGNKSKVDYTEKYQAKRNSSYATKKAPTGK